MHTGGSASHLNAHIESARRVVFIGLAKNVGKTTAMLATATGCIAVGERVGLTSTGRDGEAYDAVQRHIPKPRIWVHSGTLVTATQSMLQRCGLRHQLLDKTQFITPLGRVVIARIDEPGEVEVAGPSEVDQMVVVVDAMLASGVDRVLIDGSFDRRAAANGSLGDSIILSTGAVVGRTASHVVERTAIAVGQYRLPLATALESRVSSETVVMGADGDVSVCPHFSGLHPNPAVLAEALRRTPTPRSIVLPGALCEELLEALLTIPSGRGTRIVVRDGTCSFLRKRSVDWYAARGLQVCARRASTLKLITVNPVFPGSHKLDPDALIGGLSERIDGIPIVDVLQERRLTEDP